jgi:hypothetical protein
MAEFFDGKVPNITRRECAQSGCSAQYLKDHRFRRCLMHLFEFDRDEFELFVVSNSKLEVGAAEITAPFVQELVRLSLASNQKDVVKELDFSYATFLENFTFFNANFQERVAFDGTTFKGDFGLFDATFVQSPTFKASIFEENAGFWRATNLRDFGSSRFQKDALFNGITFDSGADFEDCTFDGPALFRNTTFNAFSNDAESCADFQGARFAGFADFADATFRSGAQFRGARFEKDARFLSATFEHNGFFREVEFAGYCNFVRATVTYGLWFNDATFGGRADLKPVAAGALCIEDADFAGKADVQLATKSLNGRRARFRRGASIGVRYGEIRFDGARFEAGSTIFMAPTSDLREDEAWPYRNEYFVRDVEADFAKAWQSDEGDEAERLNPRPVLASLMQADVAGLHVAETVEMCKCLFMTAHNLEKMRLDGNPWFLHAPRFRSSRRVIAEEILMRSSDNAAWRYWSIDSTTPNVDDEPRHIEGIYRSLRKGLEDSGDQPGAADFYYGEMEMRRLTSNWGTRWVLHLYWLLCGYALRPTRALVALVTAVIIASVLFTHIGFAASSPHFEVAGIDPHGAAVYAKVAAANAPGFWDAFAYSWQTVVLKSPDVDLTTTGRWIVVATRIAGTTLLGLFFLSIRGRVKR